MMYLACALEDLDLDEVKNKTFIEILFASFRWEEIAIQVIVASIRLLFTIFIYFIINRIAKWAIEEGFKRFIKKNDQVSNRYETIYRVVKNIYHTIYYFFLFYTILVILNLTLGI